MHILVCNDDGIYSPGIRALADVAAEFGKVRIVAPAFEQSSMGHAVTSSRPLLYRGTHLNGIEAYRVNGTPADCVVLGCHHWEHVDLVLSGVNIGLNLGNSIWHSGTLAAAKQAALLGLRGVALSAPGKEDPEFFTGCKPWIRKVLEVLLDEPLPSLVNVNFPRHPRGLVWTRVSVRRYEGHVVPTHDPQGHQLYWFTFTPMKDADEGTDRWAVERDWISMTPLSLDLTDVRSLAEVRMRRPLDGVEAALAAPARPVPEAAKEVHEDETSTPIADAVAVKLP